MLRNCFIIDVSNPVSTTLKYDNYKNYKNDSKKLKTSFLTHILYLKPQRYLLHMYVHTFNIKTDVYSY